MTQYIVECIAFQLLFLIVYDLFLRRETFFQWNRVYLIVTYVLSLLLPWIRIDAFKNTVPEHIMYYPEIWINVDTVGNNTIMKSTVEATTPISWWSVFFYTGMVLAALIFFIKVAQLFRLRSKGEVTYFKEFTRVLVSKSNTAFSFFRTIFLGDRILEPERQNIVEHELVHIKQRHSLDLLFFELLRIVNWFNPLVYVYQSRISELHEFIADAQVAKTRKKEQYQLLLSQVFQTEKISFVNHFFKSSLIKKRIVMLKKAKSKKIWGAKYLLLVPLLLCILFYTSSKGQEKGVVAQEQIKSDEELIRETNLKIDQLVQEKGSIYNVYATSEVVMKATDGDAILNKKDFFEKNLIFKRYMNQFLHKKDTKKVVILRGIQPSTENYKSYVSHKRAFQKLDKNLKISFSSTSHKVKVEVVAPNKKISRTYKVINVENAKDLTGNEIREVNGIVRKIEQENTYEGLVVTDGTLAVRATFDPIRKPETFAQQDIDEIPFSKVDKAPVFPGCADASDEKKCFKEKIQKHIRQHFRYPEEAQKQGIQGRVSVMFTIMEDGNISRIRMRGPSKILEQEAARIIGKFPKMKPGEHKGKKVRVPFSIPITFKLSGDDNVSDELTKKEFYEYLIKKREAAQNKSNGLEDNLEKQRLRDSIVKYKYIELLEQRLKQLEKEAREKADYGDIVPFSVIDDVPVFPGCEDATDKKACFNEKMQQHIRDNFRYPKEAQEKGIQGRVSVMFTIGEEGDINNIRMRGPSKILEQEAARIIGELPQMIPGKQKGENVSVPFSVPITFKLNDSKSKTDLAEAMLVTATSKTKNGKRYLSGKVSNGELGLPGVNITIKGGNKSVTTNFDGEFTIEIKSGDIVSFQYLGFPKTALVITDKEEYKIKSYK